MDSCQFPTEILCQICEQINDSRDLKALRLANHHFASISESILFRTIRLYYHSARWTALNKIADTPRLARLVECIEIENAEVEYECGRGAGHWTLVGSDNWAWQYAYDALKSCPRHHIGSTVQQTLDAIATFFSDGESFLLAKRWQDDGRYINERWRLTVSQSSQTASTLDGGNSTPRGLQVTTISRQQRQVRKHRPRILRNPAPTMVGYPKQPPQSDDDGNKSLRYFAHSSLFAFHRRDI